MIFFLFNRDLCLESWTNLRLSPMFGCICPNNHMKRRCDRIFSMVNHNPCVGKLRLFNLTYFTLLIFEIFNILIFIIIKSAKSLLVTTRKKKY